MTNANILIKHLTEKDWRIYKSLRIEALEKFPMSFASTLKEENTLSNKEWQNTLTNSVIFGAFCNSKIIGCCGFSVFKIIKMKHKATIWGMYIQPEYTGLGIADLLLKTAVDYAKNNGIKKIQLACVSYNQRAIRFYQKNGFEIYAKDSLSIKIGDKFYDDYLMMLTL